MELSRKLELRKIAAECRKDALLMVQAAHSGHLGGSLSVMDILTVLYFSAMHVDPAHPDDPDRDRCVLSKGHCTPAMYSILSKKGFFPHDELKTFRNIDSNLSGHVEMTRIPGVDMSAGSLGQGLSAALGMALAAGIDGRSYRVYCILGDGEIQEGQIWEAAQVASHYGASNLTTIIDNNRIQLDGFTERIGGTSKTAEKFHAFGWNTIEIDGHDVAKIDTALNEAATRKLAPTAIIANTVKGCGISFMENNPKWHGNVPTEEEFRLALEEIQSTIDHLELLRNGASL
ncbi:transketolase [Bifidobacterium moukalabense]|uniref:transketolase n=1 Tax=Bifidobacterium moukalabense TaxID=1333651 RepID=UPI0010F955A6|nr:transketolase [Bifidobacterium moukalabense]